MDTHYPDSVNDFDDLENDFSEEFVQQCQEIAHEASKIERNLRLDDD